MGIFKKQSKSTPVAEETQALPSVPAAGNDGDSGVSAPAPTLVTRRSRNYTSSLKSGRTIGERREHLETAAERTDAHRKIRRRQASRVLATLVGFVAVGVLLFFLGTFLVGKRESLPTSTTVIVPYVPTIEVIDEDAGATGGRITSRMSEYIGMAEEDFRALGYIPRKAVIPTGAIREVDLYLEDYSGFIKLTIDRGTGVSAEDADRVIHYLASMGVTDFQYIDVRTDTKAFWK